VHHLAFSLSQATFWQAVEAARRAGIRHSGVKDRGFMDSILLRRPRSDCSSSWRPIASSRRSLHPRRRAAEPHRKSASRRGDHNSIAATSRTPIEALVVAPEAPLSDDRAPKDPYST